MLRGDLQYVLQHVIAIMNDIELDELVKALDEIIEAFSASIDPHAVNLIATLADQYEIYRNKAHQEAEYRRIPVNLTESIKAADSCLYALKNILKANISKDTMKALRPHILSLINKAFMEETSESLEKMFSILGAALFGESSLDNDYIYYYPLLCYVVTGIPNKQPDCDLQKFPPQVVKILQACQFFGDGFEYFEPACICILNFITKSGNYFLNAVDFFGTSFINLVYEIICVLGKDNEQIKNDYDLCLSINMSMAIFESFRGSVDYLIPQTL